MGQVRPILEAAGFHLDVSETKGPGHTTVIRKETELQPVCRKATYHSCALIKMMAAGHGRPLLAMSGPSWRQLASTWMSERPRALAMRQTL